MKKNKIFKVILWITVTLAAVLIIAAICAYSYFKFVLIGNSGISKNEGFSELSEDFSEKQIFDNILNFDKQSAIEMLAALRELDAENKGTENLNENPEDNPKVPAEGKTAYERIMNEADKDEIALGMSILAKIDISKVNELRKQGKNSEIKEYLRSVLTPEEISAALKLYNKYKHLL